MSSKGKAVATGKGKGKWTGDDDKTGGGRKRRNREVLQFFEDVAEEDDYDNSEDSDLNFDFDDLMDEDNIELKEKKEPPRAQNASFMPKEEEMDEEEFDRMMEERYKSNPSLRVYRDDVYDDETNSMPSAKTPTIWKVKCTVGRERHSVFCLMQKFVELKSLGNKLQIISAFVADHAKGFIYIEAEKQIDIYEACKGLSTIYSSRLAQVPKNEVSHLLAIRNNKNPISEGMWARVKNGRYKGDLAQIMFVNDERRKATVKLIPRIDLQVLAQKIGGGVAPKNAVIPAPKLITSTELDEFRPLMTYRHDRDTNKMFEVLDGLMLKDGFLYKKVPIDSLSCHGIVPLEEELLKFRPSESNESDNLEWLTELYGGPKKKRVIGNDKGGDKGEGSSGSVMLNGFELYELVFYGRKDFGLVVGMEKGDYYKILKQGTEGPIVVTTEKHLLKHRLSDAKFIALDHKSKRISVNDTVRVFEGPLKDREGIAKQIFKGIIFIYDQNETENGGYFCSKVQMCEKVELSSFSFSEKGGESGPAGFEDFPSSPKSPLSPQKPWQTKEKNRDFCQGDKEGMFTIGQTLRIKVGPLKGYLCQVLGIRYSDITVKLGSQQKVLTVKSEHLSEVRGRSSVVPTSDDPGSSSFKPFDLLGTEGGSGGWGDGAGASKDGDGWNTGGPSTERTSWQGFATGSNPANPSSSMDNDARKEDAWDTKVSPNLNSSWGAAAADDNVAADSNQAQGWGEKAVGETGSNAGESGGWGKTFLPSENPAGAVKASADNWGQANPKDGGSSDAGGGWGNAKSIDNPTSSWGAVKASANNWGQANPKDGGSSDAGGGWGNAKSIDNPTSSWGAVKASADNWGQANPKDGGSSDTGGGWGNAKSIDNPTSSWGAANTGKSQPVSWGNDKGVTEARSGKRNMSFSAGGDWNNKDTAFNHQKSEEKTDAWGKAAEVQDKCAVQGDSWGKAAGGSSSHVAEGWGDAANACKKDKSDGANQSSNWGSGSNSQNQTGGWNKSPTEPSLGKHDGGSSWNKQQGDSSWGKQEGGSSWNKQQEGESSWSNKQDGEQQSGGWNGASDGGRGSGGRRGRGHWGGRDQSGGGRSFGQGQSSRWKGENEGDGVPSSNPSTWSNNNGAGWGKSKAEVESSSPSFRSWMGADTGTGGSGAKLQSENKDSSSKDASWGENEGASWNASKPTAAEPSGNLGAGGWNSGTTGVAAVQSGWGAPKASSADQPSSWGTKTGAVDTKSDQSAGKGWGESAADANKDSSWNSGSSNARGNAESSWGKKNNWNSGDEGKEWGKVTGRTEENKDSVWGKKENCNTGSSGAGGSQWGRKDDWNSGSNDGNANHNSGWGNKSYWNSQQENANQDLLGDGDGDGNRGGWRGGSGGRGGAGRGGFRGRGGGFGGRGRSDEGGFGGRGRSDEGGFRGRGRSDRGGFGGRGRGRRDFNAGNDNNGGSSWNSGGDGANNQAGGWSRGQGSSGQGGGWRGQASGWNKGAGSGWSHSTATKDGGSDSPAGGWSRGQGSSGPGGGWSSQASGWNKGAGSGDADADATGNQGWNQSGGAAAGEPSGSGWGKSKEAADGGSSGSGWGNSKEAAGGGASGSGWGNSKEGGEGTDAAGRGSSSNWRKPSSSALGNNGGNN